MVRRIKQILKDHKAMNLVRRGNGDVRLIFVVVGAGIGDTPTTGYECELYQGRESHFDADPASAIIGAISKFRKRKIGHG